MKLPSWDDFSLNFICLFIYAPSPFLSQTDYPCSTRVLARQETNQNKDLYKFILRERKNYRNHPHITVVLQREREREEKAALVSIRINHYFLALQLPETVIILSSNRFSNLGFWCSDPERNCREKVNCWLNFENKKGILLGMKDAYFRNSVLVI